MALADTARMLAVLDLKDGLTPVVRTMGKSLDKLDTRLIKTQNRAQKAGAQIGTGLKSAAVIAGAAITGLAGLTVVLAHEGQDAAKQQELFADAVARSGKVSGDQVAALEAQQKAVLNLTGADDELIKSEQTRLINMGLTGAAVEKLIPLIQDAAVATGKDATELTTAVGKAALGNATALQRLGIVLPKAQRGVKGTKNAVSDLQTVTDALQKSFGGAAKAVSGDFDVRLKVLNEQLKNVREEAGIKLLPAMTRIVDVVGQKLVPAFGKFVDSVLPVLIDGLDRLSAFLSSDRAGNAFENVLKIAQTAAPIIKQAASDTLTIVQTAVGLFASLPPEIQALAVAGLTINKLTGGLVTNIAGGLISAVISSFKGLMNVNAAVVNVNGPVAGLGGAVGAAEAAGGIGAGLALPLIGGAVAVTVVGSIGAREGVDKAIQTRDVKALEQIAEEARKHGVSDQNNAALQELIRIRKGIDQLNVPPGTPAVNAAQDTSEKGLMNLRGAFNSNPTREDLRNRISANKAALKNAKGSDIARLSRDIGVDQRRLAKRIADAAAKAQDQAAALTRAVRGVSDTIQANKPALNVTIPIATYINGRLFEASVSRYTSVLSGTHPGGGGPQQF